MSGTGETQQMKQRPFVLFRPCAVDFRTSTITGIVFAPGSGRSLSNSGQSSCLACAEHNDWQSTKIIYWW